ncbi:MAG: mechanosensitive ion channel family protein [Bacteroidales bacterium]|nr:mechanosensitive ion channel family protein [Bacteroidales bacterium]
MLEIAKRVETLLGSRADISSDLGSVIYGLLVSAIMIVIALGVNWVIQMMFRWISGRSRKLKKSKWNGYLIKRKLGHHILLLIPGLIMYGIPRLFYESGDKMIRYLHRADIIYMIIVVILVINSILYCFLDFYSTTDKNKKHPLQGLVQGLQVMLYFVGAIIIVAILIDKSPTVLLTGLGASAAVLMLVFKDSILGFVAGVQLSQNNMVRIGDWIQMPDGSANGNVEEITLNTVKVRNWDNTITMIPPYTLVSSPFKNWRGMQESGGRRVDKMIYIDLNSLLVCTQEMIDEIHKEFTLMGTFPNDKSDTILTNVQLFRMYIERYLRANQEVNQSLDLIITQKEATPYGLPIEVYFFLKDKAWAIFEKKQSDIFDHLMTVAPRFGLRLYQRP